MKQTPGDACDPLLSPTGAFDVLGVQWRLGPRVSGPMRPGNVISVESAIFAARVHSRGRLKATWAAAAGLFETAHPVPASPGEDEGFRR